MRKRRKERRKPIICSNCGHKMVFMKKFRPSDKESKYLHVWYVCPHRKGEGGCGHSVVVSISPRKREPRIVMSSLKEKFAEP